METFFNVATHFLIIVAELMLVWHSLRTIIDAPSGLEAKIRAVALMTGFLLVVGAKRASLDLPTLVIQALDARTRERLILVGCILPAGSGVAAAWALVQQARVRSSNDRLVRFTLLLSAFLTASFADVYAESVSQIDLQHFNLRLIPNISFVAGLGLYLIFRIDGGELLSISPSSFRSRGPKIDKLV